METEKDQWLVKLQKKYKVSIRSLRKDLKSISEIELTNEQSRNEDNKKEVIDPLEEYTDYEIEKAKELLKSDDILDQMVKTIDKAGYVHEERNKKLTYLACTSRKLPGKKKSISIVTKGESSSGKSDLVRHNLKLIPDRDFKEFTYVSEKALLHSEGDLSHKILCIFEREGGEKANYTIRTALSEEKSVSGT